MPGIVEIDEEEAVGCRGGREVEPTEECDGIIEIAGALVRLSQLQGSDVPRESRNLVVYDVDTAIDSGNERYSKLTGVKSIFDIVLGDPEMAVVDLNNATG